MIGVAWKAKVTVFTWLAGAMSVVLRVSCGAQSPYPAAARIKGPDLHFEQPEADRTMGAAYRSALGNLLDINTVPYKARSNAKGLPSATVRSKAKPPLQAHDYNQTGLLLKTPGTFIRAGGGYVQPWTRDASVNSWNAASLLEPLSARNTLWAVVRRQRNGRLIVQQDNQWWDQTIWVVAAWNHFLITGDRAFLADAYQAALETLQREEQLHFNAGYGLFEGPAFLNDGIAGYPAPPADETESRGSFVLAYPGASDMMVLSTNCIYTGAYRSAAQMAQALNKPEAESANLTAKADALAVHVQKAFWIPEQGRFGYLLDPAGKLDGSQEGAGLAFSILFDIATPEQAASILKTVQTEPHGVPDIAPAFPRYSPDRPGRHNVIVWPPIESFWAEAAARKREEAVFSREVENLAALATGSHGNFLEIYNAQTGAPDGGWQVGHQWTAESDQTWSATGYLRMMYAGLFGMRFGQEGLTFGPLLPMSWGAVTLTGVHYRQALLTVHLHGHGSDISSFTLDGVPEAKHIVPVTLQGTHVVDIELHQATP